MTYSFHFDGRIAPLTPASQKPTYVRRTRREEWEDERDLYITLFVWRGNAYRMGKAAPILVGTCVLSVAFWYGVGHAVGIW